jgi:hypothetical protein
VQVNNLRFYYQQYKIAQEGASENDKIMGPNLME